MRHISLMLVGVAAVAISVSTASATMRIIADPGGAVIDYVERFEAARVSGEPVIIDGACLSACTLAIALLPRGQVCATPKAVLGFHAAWRRTPNGGRVTSPLATQVMYEVYPEAPLARTVRSNDILQVADAAGEPVDAGDHQHVPFSQEIEHGAQLRAVRRAGA
jgi:hypothetical protein